MPFIIDAHQDLAYNALTFGRDYLRSAAEIRAQETGTVTIERTGYSLLGWQDFQRGQIAVIFGTLFMAPRRYQGGTWETQVFSEPADARRIYDQQLSYYHRLAGDHPDQFRLILSQRDLKEVLTPWEQKLPESHPTLPAESSAPQTTVTHPVGIVLLMEGVEGIRGVEEMEEWWAQGVRMAGPVWAGTRFCGGSFEPGGFTREGYALLEVMGGLGYTLDISHMTEESALQALDVYQGPVIATHANCRALLKGIEGERHLTDRVIHRLIERDGTMGVIPFNRFLRPSWSPTDDRHLVTLHTLAAHIDHICQLAGDALHAGLGTDFDGGFGWPAVPYEINTIADMPKLIPILAEYGYTEESINAIFGGNWRRHLERTLPET